MGGGNRSKSGTMSVFKRRVAAGDADSEHITMSQVNAITAKNEKAMQSIIESYRRSGNSTPLWLSTTPYYKKDSLLVINLRDENIPLTISSEPAATTPTTAAASSVKKSEPEPLRSFSKVVSQAPPPKDRHVAPASSSASPPKSFAVSGGEAASRLGLRIGAAADASPSMKKEMSDAKDAPKQPEMTIVANVRNLGSAANATVAWDTLGLDTILGGAAPVDPLTINSDPLWGADTSSNTTSDHELQTMLSVLKDLAPVTLESAPSVQRKENIPEFSVPTTSAVVTSPPPLGPAPVQVSSLQPTVPQPSQAPQNPQQYYYFMSPEGIPMMAPLPPQTASAAMPYLPYPSVQHQQYVHQVVPSQTMHPAYITPQHIVTQQQQQQQYLAMIQQQQLAASQQQAALAALQLSKGPSPKPSPTPAPAKENNTFKSPNPNARPFQPHESRFNVEAVPFVPPSR